MSGTRNFKDLLQNIALILHEILLVQDLSDMQVGKMQKSHALLLLQCAQQTAKECPCALYGRDRKSFARCVDIENVRSNRDAGKLRRFIRQDAAFQSCMDRFNDGIFAVFLAEYADSGLFENRVRTVFPCGVVAGFGYAAAGIFSKRADLICKRTLFGVDGVYSL